MRCNEVWDNELLLTRVGRRLLELLGEELKIVIGGLTHFIKHIRIDVLGCHLQVTTDVMFCKFTDVLGGFTS